jgi:hypothetical protein
MVTPADRLRERLDLEEPILTEAFPTAKLLREHNVVLLPEHQLPVGWSHETTDVLFVIPDNYPAGCPDNVCAHPDLRLANGLMPANHQGVQSIANRQWLQFSWHINGGGWSPSAEPERGSNLATYLLGALTRFEELS